MKQLLFLIFMAPLLMGATSTISITCSTSEPIITIDQMPVLLSAPPSPAVTHIIKPNPVLPVAVASDYVVPANCKFRDITWPAGVSSGPRIENLKSGQAMAFRFIMPERTGLVIAQTLYSDVHKYMSLSQNPCEFSLMLERKFCEGWKQGIEGWVGYSTAPFEDRDVCFVEEGKMYYLNVKHASERNGFDSCPERKFCPFKLTW